MDWITWLSYLGTVALIAVSPGPSVLLVSSQRMQHGARAARATIAGDLTANTLQMAAAAFGLAAVIQRSALLFTALKWIGAIYLIALGVSRILRSSLPAESEQDPCAGERQGPWDSFRRGFVVSAANPKAVIFFAGLFPLFLSPEAPLLPQLLVLGGTYLLLDGLALSIYSRFGIELKRWLRGRGLGHLEDRITGSLLTVAGIALAARADR